MSFTLLMLLSALLLSCGALSRPDPILDVDGDELKAGQQYYVRPPGIGLGPLKLKAIGERCPVHVVQPLPPDYQGKPLFFVQDFDATKRTIEEGERVYLDFAGVTPSCPESTLWIYKPSEDAVTTGGHLSPSTTDPNYSRFAIYRSKSPSTRFNQTYQIKPCPCKEGTGETSPICDIPCYGSLGPEKVQGSAPLGVNTNEPGDYVFIKASLIRTVVEGSKP